MSLSVTTAEKDERTNIEAQQSIRWKKAHCWWRVAIDSAGDTSKVRIGSREDLGCYRPFFSITPELTKVCVTPPPPNPAIKGQIPASPYQDTARVVMIQSIQRRRELDEEDDDGEDEYATIKIN
jgi:hypothetical protein